MDDNNDGKSLTWQFALTPLKTLTILANGIYGPEQASTTSPKRTVGDLVVTYKPIEPLTLAVNLNLWEITTTLKIKVLEKLFARLEYRHDQTMGRVKTAFDKKSLNFSRGQQDTVAAELYYQF